MERISSIRMRGYFPCHKSSFPAVAALVLAVGAAMFPAMAAAQVSASWERSLDELVGTALRNQMTPGAVVAVVHGDDMAFLRAFGATQLGDDGRPLAEGSLFRVGAAAELVHALAAATLAAGGGIHLDARLGDRVPGLPAELQAVTLEQLLTHTAGMSRRLAVPGRGGADDLGAAARQLTRFDRVTDPGSLYSYSEPGLMLAALALETLTNRPHGELLAESLFRPLGMGATRFGAAPPQALTPGWISSRTADSPVQPVVARGDSAVQVPVNGLYATASDLARLAAALLNDGVVAGERVLPAGAAASLLQPRATLPGTDVVAGAGMRVGRWAERPAVRVRGGSGGHALLMHLLPSERLGVIIVANKEDARLDVIADAVFRQVLDLPPASPPTAARGQPDDAVLAELAAHAGQYENGSELLEIVTVGGRPMLKSGDLLLEMRALEDGAAGALLGGQVALVVRLVWDREGRPHLWLEDRVLSPEAVRTPDAP